MQYYMNGVNGQVGKALCSSLSTLLSKPPIKISSRPNQGELYYDLLQKDDSICKTMQPGDIFIFLAAYANYNLCEKNPSIAQSINVEGTSFLIDSLLRQSVKIIFFSTAGVYGDSNTPHMETSELKSKSVYTATKRAIEIRYQNEENVKILRPSIIVAPNDNFLKYIKLCERDNITAQIFSQILSNPIGVTDVADIIVKLSKDWDSAPQIMNLCGPDIAGKEDIARIYQENINPDFKYTEVTPPQEYIDGRDTRIPVDHNRLEGFLDRPLSSLYETITKEYAQI